MNNISKNRITQWLRHIVQIISFILYPGLFILAWESIGFIYKAIITGNFSIAALLSPISVLAAVFPISIIWGRFFCSYVCAFGTFQELINIAADKLNIKKLRINKTTDKWLKYLKYVVIAGSFVIWTLQISVEEYSPWTAFGTLVSLENMEGLLSAGGFILAVIAGVSLFVDRFFCRYFCSLGGVFSIVTKPRLFRIKKNDTCVNCNICYKACPMNIDVNTETADVLRNAECIDCFKCIKECPKSSLHTPTGSAINGTVASLSILGLTYIGSIAVSSAGVTSSILAEEEQKGKYTDGTYTGSGQGYRGNTTVSVEVSNGVISSIDIVSSGDDMEFLNMARSAVISEIIASQSVDVSTVSGATFSSNGIISAVADALGIEYTNSNGTLERGHGGRERRRH